VKSVVDKPRPKKSASICLLQKTDFVVSVEKPSKTPKSNNRKQDTMSDEKSDERPGEPRPLLPLAVLSVAGQTCVDWAYDTGTCHLCGRGVLRMEKGRIAVETTMHDRDCPLAIMDAPPLEGEALREQITRDQLYSILRALAESRLAETPPLGRPPTKDELQEQFLLIVGGVLKAEIDALKKKNELLGKENAELRAQLDKGDAGFLERAIAMKETFQKAMRNPNGVRAMPDGLGGHVLVVDDPKKDSTE
jgi:hypothetical protein